MESPAATPDSNRYVPPQPTDGELQSYSRHMYKGQRAPGMIETCIPPRYSLWGRIREELTRDLPKTTR